MAITLGASMALSPCWSKSSQLSAPSLKRRSFSVLNSAKFPLPPVNPNDPFISRLASMNPESLLNKGALPVKNLNGPSMAMHGESMAESNARYDSRKSKMPNDTATKLFDKRIVYICLPLVPSVTKLIVCELMYLQWAAATPIYMYINSTGSNDLSGAWVVDAATSLAIYDAMTLVKNEIVTVNMGQAYGTAALLLAAGAKGKRFTMPCTEAFICEPSAAPSGSRPAKFIDVAAKDLLRDRELHAKLFARHTGQSEETIKNIFRSGGKFFTPEEQIAFGIVDKVYEKDENNAKTRGKEKSAV